MSQPVLHSAYVHLANRFAAPPTEGKCRESICRNLLVRAEVFDWTDKPAEGHDFDVVSAFTVYAQSISSVDLTCCTEVGFRPSMIAGISTLLQVLASDVLYERPAVTIIADLVPQLLQERYDCWPQSPFEG